MQFFALKVRQTISLFLIAFVSSCSLSAHATPQTLKYTYDALGRVTFVEDAVNGNRDYDYDAAGNRKEVVTGSATDDPPAPFTPAAPTNLRCTSEFAPGVYRGVWNASAGATYYIYGVERAGSTVEHTLNSPATSLTVEGACKWVKACVAGNLCSAKAYF